MSYKLYLDDIRIPQDTNYIVVRSYIEFVNIILERGIPEEISFDHDLADEHYDHHIASLVEWADYYKLTDREYTGYDCAKWLIDYCNEKNLDLPKRMYVHSMNPVGKMNIVNTINHEIKRRLEHEIKRRLELDQYLNESKEK